MKALCMLAILVAPARALAWDGPALWYWPATGDDSVMYGNTPGGGGILGTGGQHDHGIKCTDCHVQRAAETFGFTLSYSPVMVNNMYVPGQRYTVTAAMTGATLPCDPTIANATKKRGFAASYEDDSGAQAGAFVSDAGQSAPSCKLPPPAQTQPAGSTYLDGDCEVIFGASGDLTSWRFTWTAPASGTVHVYWGAVDGNCDMMSMNDAAQTNSTTLVPAMMRPVRWLAELISWLAS